MFYALTHDTQNLVDGLSNLDPHIGGNELHRCCYNLLQPRWNVWSGGYHLPIEKTTLRGIKVIAAIAGKDLIGPARERDAILEFFMKPRGKTGEPVFKTGQLDLAIVIDPEDLESVEHMRERIHEVDDNSAIIRHKVCIHGLMFIDLSRSPHSDH